MVDGRLPIHARRLSRVGVELVTLDDANAVVPPVVLSVMIVIVLIGHSPSPALRHRSAVDHDDLGRVDLKS
jgi:hypothetical protein